MDNINENIDLKRKIEVVEGDTRTVKMEADVDHVQANTTVTTPGPRRKKLKKQKKDVDKSALMLFHETFPSVEFTLESSSGPSHEPEFVMCVELEGNKYEGRARSKKEAKQMAAESALRSKGLWPMQQGVTQVKGDDSVDAVMLPLSDTLKKPTREEAIVKAINDGKNPVSVTHEYHPGSTFTIVSDVGRSHSKIFTSELVINGERYQGTGASKKAANVAAAARAMFELYGVIHCNNNQDVSDPADLEYLVPQPLADKIGEIVSQKFALLTESGNAPNLKRKVLAGFVKTVQKGEEVVEMDVISLGTGTKCIAGENISNAGQALNDCHGEVIARRGLCHYLYDQLDLAVKGKAKMSCFSKKKNGQYALKEGVAFHLYISTSPCGDGRIFSPKEKAVDEPGDRHPQRKTRGLLRTKIENGEGTLPVRVGGVVQTWDGVLQGERLLTMSCSDKISKWNVVGLQGALLSHFIEPIYLTSVVLGSLYNFHHLTRALYRRLGVLDLPAPYHHNYHLVNGISLPEPRATGKSPSCSLNWCWGEDGLECVNASNGKLENEAVSRLSKNGFFLKFLALWKKMRRNVAEPATYHEAKHSAENYRHASSILKKEYVDKELGKWVEKPIEQDDF